MKTRKPGHNNHLNKSMITDLVQLQSGPSPERSFYYGEIYEIIGTGDKSKIR